MDISQWTVAAWLEVVYEDDLWLTFAFTLDDGPIIISTVMKD